MRNFFTLLFFVSCTIISGQVVAQNVGIGTLFPDNGKLVIKNSGLGSALVVSDSSTGISFNEYNSPIISFNNHNVGGTRKLMADGFSSFLYFNPFNGSLYFNNSAATGTQGTTPTLTNRLAVSSEGFVGIGTSSPTAGLHLSDRNVVIENASGLSDIILTANTGSFGGEMQLQNNAGNRTVALRAGDGSGVSGELVFFNGTGSTTLEMDGDYGATGRSRIIVDELQIKGGADFAEYFDVKETNGVKPEPGMLVSIDDTDEGKMTLSSKPYDNKVAGVISGANGIKPGMMMGHKGTIADGKEAVAISGRVYVKAETSGSAIKPGDLLTTSGIAGYAMKVANQKKATGAIIGKAMGSLAAGKRGYVLILLNIQ